MITALPGYSVALPAKEQRFFRGTVGSKGIDSMAMNRRPNRLIHEASPYLQQHAHNPVDWYPWGTEALERSKQEDKPIFLSIGYSACHWCHVRKRYQAA